MRAVERAATREILWGLPTVTREIRHWRARAELIPSPAIREDALHALANRRMHADGAALFSTVPDRRDAGLIRLLVRYELILDFLDNTSERHPTEENGRRLHLALIDAVDPRRTPVDYYRHHPWQDDAGYLRALVESCQRLCHGLPSYRQVRATLLREAKKTQVLALNHLVDAAERDAALQRWAAEECPLDTGLAWYECSAAGSSSLVVLALLTLGSRIGVDPDDVEAIRRAYWPWVSLAAPLLDSYVDQADDATSGDHSYVAHYPDSCRMRQRLAEVIERAVRSVEALPDGPRHAVIVKTMIAMYLSKDYARTPELIDDTHALVRAGGTVTMLLVPILRLWRIAYSHQTA